MYKRGNVYWCKITRPGGKPVCQSLGRNKKLAKELEAKLRLEISKDTFFDNYKGKCISVSGLLDIYRERHALLNKNPETCKTDIYMGKTIIKYLGDHFLPDVTPSILEGYMAQRRIDGVSDITIHHELNLLRHAFSLALKKWDLIEKTPFTKVTLPKGDRKIVRYLKPDEEKRLFDALKGNRWLESVVIIARETGLRLSNICNLTWDQVDLFKRFIEIEKAKNGNPVWIPMTNKVYTELKGWNKVRDLKEGRVFVVNGKLLHRDWVGRAFRRLCKRAGIINFRFHDLRHDFCSRLVQAGQSLHVVAALAGHQDISTTQRYAHLSPESKREAISTLDDSK